MVLSYTPNKEVAGTPQFSQLAQESDPTVQGIIRHNSRLLKGLVEDCHPYEYDKPFECFDIHFQWLLSINYKL